MKKRKVVEFPISHSKKVHFEPEVEKERVCGACSSRLIEPASKLNFKTESGSVIELCPGCRETAMLPREELKRLLAEKIEEVQKYMNSTS